MLGLRQVIRPKTFMPWTSSRQATSPKFFSRINLDAASYSESFQPRSGIIDGVPYNGMPLFSGDTGSFVLCLEEFEYFKAFFNSRKGKYRTFLHKNWMDYKATNQPLVSCLDQASSSQGVTYPSAGDGARVVFALLKKYSHASGSINYRQITNPIPSTLMIYTNGVLIPSTAYQLSGGGQITFASPPASLSVTTFDCEYELTVRFDSDSYAATVLNALPGFEEYKINAIPIVEVDVSKSLILAAITPPLPPCDLFYSDVAALLPLRSNLAEVKFGLGVSAYPNITLPVISSIELDPFGNAGVLELDGFQGFQLASSTLDLLGSFSIEMWVKPTALLASTGFLPGFFSATLIETRVNSQDSAPFNLYVKSDGSISCVWVNGLGGANEYTSNVGCIVLGAWNYINISRQGSIFTVHCNGALVLTVASSGLNMTSDSVNWFVGGFKPSPPYDLRGLKGFMSNFRVTKNFVRNGLVVPTRPFELVACTTAPP